MLILSVRGRKIKENYLLFSQKGTYILFPQCNITIIINIIIYNYRYMIFFYIFKNIKLDDTFIFVLFLAEYNQNKKIEIKIV